MITQPSRPGATAFCGLLLAASIEVGSMADQGAPAPIRGGAAPGAAAAATESPAADLVVRIHYGDPAQLGSLASRYDLFGPVDHDQGSVLARVGPEAYQELRQAGYRVDLDDALTAQANARLLRSPGQATGIPGYACYRTVEETEAALVQLAARTPTLASLRDIGDSWDRTVSEGDGGYDLLVLVLSNQAIPGPKPRFFLMAAHHARELVTAETATRFAEDLVGRYDADPDVTWLLDYHEIHILPLANPDGRKFAEQGYWWRKNTDQTNGCIDFPNFGTDLNRNCGFKWGGAGASSHPCDDIYRGPTAFSEPENVAIRDYVRSLFPDQRGPEDTDPAPEEATGLFVSLHSFGELILHPWAWTTNAAPNETALASLGGKLAFFNRHTVQPGYRLYATTGSADEWAYGELGIAAFTIEMGTTFFESCPTFERQIDPMNRAALLYAAKACRQPYLSPAGPEVVEISLGSATNLVGTPVALRAVADSSRSYGVSLPLPVRPIAGARYCVDQPSWTAGVQTYPMSPQDGSLGSVRETIEASLDTTGWAPGRHTLFLEAQNADGRWGVPTAVFLWVTPLTLSGAVDPSGFVLSWPSLSNRVYTLLQAEALESPFSVLAGELPAEPPTNRYPVTPPPSAPRFYQLRLENRRPGFP